MAEQQDNQKKAQENGSRGLLSPENIAGASPTSKRGRRAAGWRGLSVDLITGDPESVAAQLNAASAGQKDKGKARDDSDSDSEEEEDLVKVRSKLFKKQGEGKEKEEVGKEERLEGVVIKVIWKQSGLEKRRLAEIWNECDPTQSGSLDIEGFVKGMWRIDEELRRAQTQLLKSATGPGGFLGTRNSSANSSRTSLLSSKHSSIASVASGRPASLSRQSSVASQQSTTLGSRSAAYQKLTGTNAPSITNTPPPPSSYNAYNSKTPVLAYRGGGYNGNTPYGAGYSGYGAGGGSGGGGGFNMKKMINDGAAGIGSLNVTMPSAVRNILRGS